MILACSSCHARYLISASLFAHGPRQVRCARCSHSWEASLANNMDAVGPSPEEGLTPPPDSVRPIPAGSNVPVIQKPPMSPLWRKIWAGMAVAAVALVLLWLVIHRHEIGAKYPQTEGIYNAFGLRIYRFGEELDFTGVRSELRYEGGKMLLAVEGKIHNGSDHVQEIPDIQALALGVDGATVQSWQINAPAVTVEPGADVDFHSSIDAPKDAVAEINLSFIETKHDADQ